MERISSNSQALKEKFPEVYREFFSKCHTVVSVPGRLFWAGDLLGYYGGLCLIQKVPLRTYIGLSRSKSGRTTVAEEYSSFITNQQNFKSRRIDTLAHSLGYSINNIAPYNKLFSNKCHLQFLSEHPIEAGVLTHSPITAAVAFELSLYNRLISPEQFFQWSETPVVELKNNSEYGFVETFLRAWNFVEAVRDSYSSGVTTFNAFVNSAYPIVYFSEGKNWHAWRLNELLPLPKMPYWPIDFGLVFTRGISKPDAVTLGYKNRPENIYYITEEIRKTIKQIFPHCSTLTRQIIKSRKSFWTTYLSMFNVLSLTIFYSIANLMSRHISKNEFRLFFNSLNQYQNLFYSLGLSNEVIEAVSAEIQRYATRGGTEIETGVKTTGLSGGEVLFAIPSNSSLRREIDGAINFLQKKYESDITLDYASWLDGYETEGIKIEQSLEQGIYSEFISRDAVKVKAYTSTQPSPQIFLLSPEEFEREKSKTDLLLDEKKNKIYLRGQEMSSNELHSSKFTIAVLKILLANPGREIKNRQLPDLSYRSNRYDLQGKITDPLKRALLKHTHKDLALRVAGGIVDFSLKLELDDLKIWLIEGK